MHVQCLKHSCHLDKYFVRKLQLVEDESKDDSRSTVSNGVICNSFSKK